MSSNMHEAHFGFHHDIVSCSLAVWSILAIASDAGVYEFWVDFGNGFVVHAIFLECSWKIVLDEYIAVLGQLVKDIHA